MSTEMIVAALTAITGAGGVLTAAFAKLWTWVDKRVTDCEKDRMDLHGKIAVLHVELKDISRSVGQMEGELKGISSRNQKIDEGKK